MVGKDLTFGQGSVKLEEENKEARECQVVTIT